MKTTVKIILFLLTIFIVTYLYRENIQSDLVQYISIGGTLSVIFIGFIIFMENRHPTQTLAWRFSIVRIYLLFIIWPQLSKGENVQEEILP